jgi:hypothetical protein
MGGSSKVRETSAGAVASDDPAAGEVERNTAWADAAGAKVTLAAPKTATATSSTRQAPTRAAMLLTGPPSDAGR